MALFLECLEGPAQGQKFRIAPGIRMGRTTGEILIQDPKISSLHAQVESSEKGQLYLVDRDSNNGLRISGQKVKKVALLPGVRFQAGESVFKVIELVSEALPVWDLETKDNWKKVLKDLIPKLAAHNNSQEPYIQKFDPLLELVFLEGIQAQTKILLGYGPRKAGSDVLDIELQDPEAPDVAFELLPDRNGNIRFETAFPDLVRLNDSHVTSDQINSGDLIRIGATLIEVKFLT